MLCSGTHNKAPTVDSPGPKAKCVTLFTDSLIYNIIFYPMTALHGSSLLLAIEYYYTALFNLPTCSVAHAQHKICMAMHMSTSIQALV